MQSGNQESFLSSLQKSILISILLVSIVVLFFFKNLFFQPSMLIKNFGQLSIDPEIAFNNNKPTFLEFYAEWCEVCKEMAPKVVALKDDYEKDINFVFLNVDNPKWDFYIKKFNVNGIPQVNLFDSQGGLKNTFIGRQKQDVIKYSLDQINDPSMRNQKFLNSENSQIGENKNYQSSPRSHG